MANTLSNKLKKALLATMLAVAVLFLAIGIPIQLEMTDNQEQLITFSLDTIATRDNDNLANELFEKRNRAIQLRLQEILNVEKVLDVAIYDGSGALLEAASTDERPPETLDTAPLSTSTGYVTGHTLQGFTFIKPIRAVGETLGWIRIVYDMSGVRKQTVIYYAFFGGLLALSLGCFFVLMQWRMKQLIITPLNTMISAMQNARPDETILPTSNHKSTEEINSLFTTYNDMSDRLYQSYAELEKTLAEKAVQAAALEESELRFRTIVNQAPVGIMMFDNDGVVTDANAYFASVMGAPTPDHIRGIHMLTDIKDPHVVACVREALDTGAAFYEDYYTSVSGQKTVYTRVRLLRISPDLLCGVFEDLTEQKEMLKALSDSEERLAALNRSLEDTVRKRTQALTDQANELREANDQLKELDSLKTAFLSSVSHELRTPLTSILGFTKVTLKQFRKHVAPLVPDTPAITDRVHSIEDNLTIVSREGERLARLVNDVLDMARIESGRMPWNDAVVDVSDVISNVVSASAGDFQGTDVILESRVEAPLPAITIDPDKLFQMIRNLIHNSAKFTKKGSVMVLATHHPDDNEIEIRVQDTGPGIAAQNIDSIFDKFHQIQHASDETAKPKGSGLGLAICQQFVEHYNGRIWVESEPDQGASFIIRLPAA